MKELKDIWNEIPERSLEQNDIKSLLGKRSISEVDRFKRILWIELYASWALVAILLFVYETIGKETMTLICMTVLLGSVLNIVTLRKISQLRLLDDVRSFLIKVVRALKAFVTAFILTAQMIGVFVLVVIKTTRYKSVHWLDWLLSEAGISAVLILVVVELILLIYAYVVYFKRIHSLKRIVKEMER